MAESPFSRKWLNRPHVFAQIGWLVAVLDFQCKTSFDICDAAPYTSNHLLLP